MERDNNELISVIVPFYNGEKYLKECIDSILNQDYKKLEILLVNDGSKDNTINLLKEYEEKDKRVILINQKNAGVSSARNSALDKATGKYICLIDQDDYIDKDYISYFYKLIKENNADIALTPMPYKTNESNKLKKQDIIKDNIEIWSGDKATEEMLYYNLVIAPWNKMISKEIIDQYQIRFNPSFFGGEGFSFSIDCFQRAKKVVIGHKKVYNYRVDNPNSGMTKFNMKVIDSSIESQKYIRENLVNKSEKLLKACKYSNWHTYYDCLNTMVGCKVTKKYPETYDKLKKVCHKDALSVVKAPIPKKEKIKGFLYFISPYFTAKIINHFRIRKFTIDE